MDFMNLNQAAHGDREHGFIMARLRMNRRLLSAIEGQIRQAKIAACPARRPRGTTGGRQVRPPSRQHAELPLPEATRWPRRFIRFAVNGYGVGDLVKLMNQSTDTEVDGLTKEYTEQYRVAPELKRAERNTARCCEARASNWAARISQAGQFQGLSRRV